MLDQLDSPISDLSDLVFGPRLRGALDGLRNGHIIGWVIDLQDRMTPLDVELIVEGATFGKRSTYIPRLDISQLVGDNVAGFDIDLWSFRRSLVLATIRKLLALSDLELDGHCDLRLNVGDETVTIEANNFNICRRRLLDEFLKATPPGVTIPTRQIKATTPAPKDATTVQAQSDVAETVVPESRVETALVRASRRVQVLSAQVKKYEHEVPQLSNRIDQLQSRLAVIAKSQQALEEANSEFKRRGRQLEAEVQSLERRNGALTVQTSELRSALLKTIGNLCSHIQGFDRFSKQVDYDTRRLFAFKLETEIRESRMLLPDVKAHALAVRDIFDPLYYIVSNSDVTTKGINPLLHYITIGYREGRRPNLLFDVEYYKAQVGDITEDPLLHFARLGASRRINPHPLFDCEFYETNNPDVAAAGWNPLFHYQTIGGVERRDPSILFDTECFLSKVPAAETVECPLEHYLTHWRHECVDPHPLFSARYLAQQAAIVEFSEAPFVTYLKSRDIRNAFAPHPLFSLPHLREIGVVTIDSPESPLEQYLKACVETDLSPHPVFDAPLYRYQIEVERESECPRMAVIDYLTRGYLDETLLPNILFDPIVYRSRNDVEFTGPALLHYLEIGDGLGVTCHQIFDTGFYNAQRTDPPPRVSALEHIIRYPDEGLIPDRRLGRPFDPEVFDFLKQVVQGGGEYDLAFYYKANPDLRNLTPEQAHHHFVHNGRAEKRLASARLVLLNSNSTLRDIPIGMSADEYCDLSPDLNLRGQTLRALCHYIPHGRHENRLVGKWQLKLDGLKLQVPTRASPLHVETGTTHRTDVCILTHIFYPDLWPELASFARNFDSVTRDVFVNVVDLAWTPAFQLELRRLCPGAFVQLSIDSGRDIGGFVRLLDNVDIDRYEVFAFMHSKKSPHIPIERGNYWRQCLLQAFAGSPEIVQRCMNLFQDEPDLGIIGAESWRSEVMGDNVEQYEKLLDVFGIEGENRKLDYLSGTMFLVRRQIVKRLHEELTKIDWEYGGDQGVEFHLDGQIAHGVERVIPALARHMGYRVVWN